MFILLKHNANYKGIIIITHAEHKFINTLKERLSNKYFIYGHWCNGYPNNLTTKLATYFTDNIFYENRITDETTKKINILFKKNDININIDNNKYFDFIHIGRTCKRKNQMETYKIMKKAITLNKKCLLILIPDIGNDPGYNYLNSIINDYKNSNSQIRENLTIICGSSDNNKDYCIRNSFSYYDLSLFLNYSKIYVHSTYGFDEARIIGQALLSGCLLLCNEKLEGHTQCRMECKDAVVEYNSININKMIDSAIEKQYEYKFNEKLNKLYNEKINVINELHRYYNECNYKNVISLKDFLDNCDKKLWSLKIAGHYNNVPWNIKDTDTYKYGNPTHHIQHQEQFELLYKHLNV